MWKTTKESALMVENKFSAEPWLGIKEISEYLGVTVVTDRKWISSAKYLTMRGSCGSLKRVK
jgi:hypothetical protein